LGFQTGSDNERIDDLQRQLDDIIDSQLTSEGGNENLSIDSTRGQRNAASGDAGGVRSNEPIIHNITENDESGTPTGVFDKINLISSMIIVDHTSTPIDLRFIQGPAKDGSKIKITVKKDKVLVIKSGGNILTSTDITITDTEFYILVKHSETETGVTGGAYKIFVVGAGGITSPPFIDSDPLVKGSVDDTKLLRFEIDGFTTATTRVITIPDASVTMAGLGVLSQTWTGTNIFTGPVAIFDTDFFIQDGADITKQLNFALEGGSTGQVLTLASQITGNRTLTFPDTTTDLAGLGTLSQSWTGTNIFVGITDVRDGNFSIQNIADNTKEARFDSSDISTSTVRTFTLPDSTTTLAGLGVPSQTWTGTNIFSGITDVVDESFSIQDFDDLTSEARFDCSLISASTVRTFTLPNSTTTLTGLGVPSQTWTGTNDFVGTTTVIDSNFGIKDFGDNTKVASFDSSLIATATTRTYSLPDSTTTLAGLGVVSQSWTGTNTYAGPSIFNGNVTLGSDSADTVTFNADTVGNITPNVDDTDDLGAPTQAMNFIYVKSGHAIIEGYATGFRPGNQTNTAILFTVPTGGGLTELRVVFQTGGSIIIETEV